MVSAALSLTLLSLGDPSEGPLTDELALQGVSVVLREAPAGFADASLTTQLDWVRPDPGGAVAWVVGDPDSVHLHLAFVEDRRAVVRVVDGSRAEIEPLALSAREILAAAFVLPPAPPPVPPTGPVDPVDPVDPVAPRRPEWGAAAVGFVPVVAAAGPRGGAEVSVGLPIADRGSLGAAVGAQLGRLDPRVTAAAVGRWDVARVGVGVDLVRLPWVVWVEPRIELGVELGVPVGPGRLTVEPRIRVAPVRDRVERGDVVQYDSGWAELGIVVGARQIHPRP